MWLRRCVNSPAGRLAEEAAGAIVEGSEGALDATDPKLAPMVAPGLMSPARTLGRDQVNHPPGGKDDASNAAALALVGVRKSVRRLVAGIILPSWVTLARWPQAPGYPAGVIGVCQLLSLPVWQRVQRLSSPFLKYLQNRV
jgi:hypothetical protein